MVAVLSRCYGTVACIGSLSVVLLGCGEQPQIRSYDVPKTSSDQRAEADGQEDGPSRMVAAIILRENKAWFIKALEPADAIEPVADELRQFVAAIELPSDDPDAIQWEVPDNWQQGADQPMREATLLVPGTDPPVEVAISNLAYDDDEQRYLLANINRWRGQLGLAAVQQLNDSAGVTTMELDGGQAWFFDAAGEDQASSMAGPPGGARAPFAGGQAPPSDLPTGPPENVPQLELEVPDTWKEQPRGSMGSRNYAVDSGEGQVAIKISDFPPFGMMADPLSNFNRWRGQLNLPPLTADELPEETEPVTIAGAEGVLSQFSSDDQSQAMLAAMIENKGRVWFFQLLGEPAAVTAEREAFVEWLGSVRVVADDNPAQGEE